MDPRWLEYIELFNERDFYDCHEVLEELWLDEGGPDRSFYKAMIHFATAFQHLFRGNRLGLEARLRSTLTLLEPYPDFHVGLDVEQVRRVAREWLDVTLAQPPGVCPRYVDARVPKLHLLVQGAQA